MATIIDFKSRRELYEVKRDEAYSQKLSTMDKLQLLEEMVNFNDKRDKLGLSVKSITEGLVLFKLLQTNAETVELREVSTRIINDLQSHLDKYKKVWNE
jgi:hypothetical protein